MSSWPLGLTTAQFWGAVGGVVVGIICLIFVAYYLYKRCNSSASEREREDQYISTTLDVAYGAIPRKDEVYVQLEVEESHDVRLIESEDKRRISKNEPEDEDKIAWTNIEPSIAVEVKEAQITPDSPPDSINRKKGKSRKNKKALLKNEENSPLSSPLTSPFHETPQSPLHETPQSLGSLIASNKPVENEKLKYFGSSTLITKKKPFQSSLYEISESQPDELVEIPLLPPPINTSLQTSLIDLQQSKEPQYHVDSLPPPILPPILPQVTENISTIVLEEEPLTLSETTTYDKETLPVNPLPKLIQPKFNNNTTPVNTNNTLPRSRSSSSNRISPRTSPVPTRSGVASPRTAPLLSKTTPTSNIPVTSNTTLTSRSTVTSNTVSTSTTTFTTNTTSSTVTSNPNRAVYQVNPNHVPHPVNASLLTSNYGNDDDSDPSWSDEDALKTKPSKSSRSSASSSGSSYYTDSDTEEFEPVSPRAKPLPVPRKSSSSALSSSDHDMPPSDLPPVYLPPPIDFLTAKNYQDNTQSFIDLPPPSDLPPLFIDTNNNNDLPPPSDLPPQLIIEPHPKIDNWTKRWNIAQEILETEVSFNLGLKLIDSQFYQPLLTSNIVDISLVNAMFPQSLQTVIIISDQFLEILRGKLANQNGETLMLGEAFISLAPLLRNHSPYVNNYIESYNTYSFCQRTYPKFHEFVTHPKRANIFVENILITVIQRSPRYVLFLRDLLKVTPESHPDYVLLQQAERVVVDSVTYINEQKRLFDQQKYSIALQMEFKIPIDHARTLIHEEKVWKQPNESGVDLPETYKFVIFSDFILLVKFQDGLVVKGKKYSYNRHSLRILKDCVATAFEYHNETYFTETADMRLKLIQVCRKNGINVYIEGETASDATVNSAKSPRALPNVPTKTPSRRDTQDTLKRSVSQKSMDIASSVGEAKEKAGDILKIGSEKAGKTAEDLLKKATSGGTVSKKVKKKGKNLLGGIF